MLMSESTIDQAAGLRQMINPKPVKVIAVGGGKGGIGKSNVSVNLAVALAEHGREVLLFDADLGLANIDVLLGINPAYDLSHVISGQRTLEEIIVEGPANIKIVPASSGIGHMARLEAAEHAGIIQAFSELAYQLDVMIVDTAAGVSGSVVNFCQASQEVIVVVCDEPASITDAYAFIKIMSRDHGVDRFQVLTNMVSTANEGRALFNKLSKATDAFLDVTLSFMGIIPHDERLRKAVQHQRAVVEVFPRSASAIALKKLARQVDKWPVSGKAGGQLEFFVERLIEADSAQARPLS